MAKMRENKYLCDTDFTQSDQCFRNKYDVNINTSTVHDSRVMLLLSRGGHLSVYQDGNISTDLVRNFCLRTDCFRDLFTQRYSSFSTAQGEVNLPRAALERVNNISEVYIAFKIWSCLMVTCNKRFYSLCAIWHAHGISELLYQ